MSGRAVRRVLGKRRLRREAHRDVVRVIELSEEGYSASTISASVGLTEHLVREILDRAEEVRTSPDVPPAA